MRYDFFFLLILLIPEFSPIINFVFAVFEETHFEDFLLFVLAVANEFLNNQLRLRILDLNDGFDFVDGELLKPELRRVVTIRESWAA